MRYQLSILTLQELSCFVRQFGWLTTRLIPVSVCKVTLCSHSLEHLVKTRRSPPGANSTLLTFGRSITTLAKNSQQRHYCGLVKHIPSHCGSLQDGVRDSRSNLCCHDRNVLPKCLLIQFLHTTAYRNGGVQNHGSSNVCSDPSKT